MEAHRRSWIGYTAAVLMAIALLSLVFGRDLRLPGLFMDSINPEYMAVKTVNEEARPDTPTLVMPGNIIAGKYPVLAGSYYHGPLQFYVALPVYAALGTTIVSARIVQALYGVFILLGLALIARRYPIRLGIAATMLALLAIDPAFSLALKTQAYNVMWPLVWMLLAIAAAESWATRRVPPRAWQLLWSGLLMGVAFFCYFVFLFFVPALALYLLHCLRNAGIRDVRRTLGAFALNGLGFGIGCLGYLVGYKLAANAVGGWRKFVEFNQDAVQNMVLQDHPAALPHRIEMAWHWMQMALSDHWVSMTVLRTGSTSWLGNGKAILLVAAPLLLFVLLRLWRVRSRLLELCLLLSISFFLVSLLFGAKIGGHHFTVLVPLMYLAIAAGVTDAWPKIAESAWLRVPSMMLLGVFVLALLVDGVIAHSGFSQRLRETGGVDYYSDAIDQYAAHALSNQRNTVHYFPDWGLIMPFVFLTGGREDTELHEPSPEQIARAICNGKAVEVAYIPAASATALAARLRGGPLDLAPQVLTFRSRDGKPTVGAALYMPTSDPRIRVACAAFRSPASSLWKRDAALRLDLEPATVDTCSGGASVIPVRVHWDVSKSGAHSAAIWLFSGTQRRLWFKGAPAGSAVTGAWMNPGAGVEVLDGTTGERLAVATMGGRICQ